MGKLTRYYAYGKLGNELGYVMAATKESAVVKIIHRWSGKFNWKIRHNGKTVLLH